MKKRLWIITALLCSAMAMTACRKAEPSSQSEMAAVTEDPQGDNTASQEEPARESSEDFVYEQSQDGITLTGYTGAEEELFLPSEIDGMAVTAIGESCFAGNVHIKKVHVPEGVAAIEDYAFECCSAMEKIYLPYSLKCIGAGAFSGCGKLYMVDVQEGLEEIKDGAFLACGELLTFVAPASLKSIGEYSFALCKGMYHADLRKTRIETVPDRAFYGDLSLVRITIPENTKGIGKRAFAGCEQMEIIYLPDRVRHIASYAFANCSKLSSIDVKGGDVDAFAFDGCHGLKYVNFAEVDTLLHKDAFGNCGVQKEDQYLPECVLVEEGAFPAVEENQEMQEEEATSPAEETSDQVPDWDDIKTVDEILKDAETAGYRVVTNGEFEAWSAEYLDYNKDTASFEREENIYTDMYKGEIQSYYKAMTAAASKDPDDIESAAEVHGDDFMSMYEMANHGLLTEMRRFKMKDDLLLLTGVYDSQLKAAAGTTSVPSMEELKARVGSTFTDKCLTSTTNDIHVATHFSDTMFIIYAPAESVNSLGAVCMDAYMHTPENETLLYSGAEYEILDAGYFSYEKEEDTSGKKETAYEKYVLLQLCE